MKAFLLSAACAVLAGFAGLYILARVSRAREPETGLAGGRLRPCATSGNCVCSEHPDAAAAIEPLRFKDDPASAWRRAREAVTAMGGTIRREDEGYLRAEFRTPLFGFADDLELRLDAAGGAIQVRSASRVGRSDHGANRRRVEALRAAFAAPPLR